MPIVAIAHPTSGHVVCYSNYAEGFLFKVGQLIVFSYTFARATYWEEALMQTKLILTSHFVGVILIAYSYDQINSTG